MKNKIFFSVALMAAAIILLLSLTGTDNPDKKFLITVMHAGMDTTSGNYDQLADLKINAWHRYNAWFTNDDPYQSISYISPKVNYRVGQNNQRNLRTVFGRPITDYSGWGQRSDYQCEKIDAPQDYWFYSFNTSVINTWIQDVSDSGQIVKRCEVNTSNPGSNAGYIVMGLKANREQANRLWTPFQADSLSAWYVKPRIRIPTGLPSNTQVCRIEVFDLDSNIVRSVELIVGNFKDSLGNYDGRYMDKFYFQDILSAIKLEPGEICPGPYESRKDHTIWYNVDIDTDYRVYWYGQCSMWIDRIRVENEQARLLYEDPIIKEKISSEVHSALIGYNSSDPVPNNFYIEEFEFNTTPCLKEVNRIIDSVSQGKLSLSLNLNYSLYNAHIPFYEEDPFTASDLKKYLIDSVKVKTVVTGSYPFTGEITGDWRGLHPSTLCTQSYNKSLGILSYVTTVSNYEDSLQIKLDNYNNVHSLINSVKVNDELSKLAPEIRLNFLGQAYMWWQKNGLKLKEPSNEETKLLANIAISYGAKGYFYFCYDSHNAFTDTVFFSRGMTNTNLTPRDSSVYGQDRWEGVKQINSILEKWGPYIMSFDNANRQSYIYRLEDERIALNSNTYFTDVVSYKSGTGNPTCNETDDPGGSPSNLRYECNDDRYLQVATFNNPNEDHTNYFMIVNRRCSPFINDSTEDKRGGRRFIRVRFDANHSNFNSFNNWKIIDLEKDSTIVTFNKQISSLLNLGWYLPGEGKLYKLAPVMQEGGTLVTDEVIAGQNFVCKAQVDNNGKNIKITGGSIQFKEDAGINMNKGIFICSGNGVFAGYNHELWTGIYLRNTGQDSITDCTFDDAFTSINLQNDTAGYYHTKRVIKNNNINVPNEGVYGIYGINNFRLLIQDNDFTAPSDTGICLHLCNRSTGLSSIINVEPTGEGTEVESPYYLNIIHNTFTNGNYSAVLVNFAQHYLGFLIAQNTFNYAKECNLLLRQAEGSIKNNSFASFNTPTAIRLNSSSPALYNNSIKAKNSCIMSTAHSFPKLSSLRTPDYLSWIGGKNYLNSYLSDNTSVCGVSNMLTDFGNNTFIDTNRTKFNIFGALDTNFYYTRQNCWQGSSVPKIQLTYDTLPVDVRYFSPGYYCNSVADVIDYSITQTVFGIMDTVILTENDIDTTVDLEEVYYSQAEDFYNVSRFSDAIFNFKLLIDNFTSGVNLQVSVYDLYSCYEGLDTSANTDYRDTLYGNLKNYCVEKLESEQYNFLVEDALYENTILCDINMENYDDAMDGYEFIALFHPDPDVRLAASWNYAELEELLSGGGAGQLGIKNYELGIEEQLQITNDKFQILESNEMERLNKIIGDNPLMSKMKREFDKTTTEKKNNIERKLKNETEENTVEINRSYSVKFDGSNLSSGIYFLKIQAGDFVATKKMVLLK